jgi:hypothetical protein
MGGFLLLPIVAMGYEPPNTFSSWYNSLVLALGFQNIISFSHLTGMGFIPGHLPVTRPGGCEENGSSGWK